MPYDALAAAFDRRNDVRLHLCLWQMEKPLLFFVTQGVTLMNPISQHLPDRERIDPKTLGRVFYVGNSPHDDLESFVRLNGKPKSSKIFYRPGKRSALIVMEMPVPEID